ncbi:MAG: hypothetical protein EA385_15145 [Salinarimonadaceae bacterium]|nr:MAG: hypothetical protein EA385_15145 [Salinarimonadaceae bacterium]
MAKEFAFDVKLWAVVRCTAPDEATARTFVREAVDCLDIGTVIERDGCNLTLTEASAEGDLDLVEIDGEAV